MITHRRNKKTTRRNKNKKLRSKKIKHTQTRTSNKKTIKKQLKKNQKGGDIIIDRLNKAFTDVNELKILFRLMFQLDQADIRSHGMSVNSYNAKLHDKMRSKISTYTTYTTYEYYIGKEEYKPYASEALNKLVINYKKFKISFALDMLITFMQDIKRYEKNSYILADILLKNEKIDETELQYIKVNNEFNPEYILSQNVPPIALSESPIDLIGSIKDKIDYLVLMDYKRYVLRKQENLSILYKNYKTFNLIVYNKICKMYNFFLNKAYVNQYTNTSGTPKIVSFEITKTSRRIIDWLDNNYTQIVFARNISIMLKIKGVIPGDKETFENYFNIMNLSNITIETYTGELDKILGYTILETYNLITNYKVYILFYLLSYYELCLEFQMWLLMDADDLEKINAMIAIIKGKIREDINKPQSQHLALNNAKVLPSDSSSSNPEPTQQNNQNPKQQNKFDDIDLSIFYDNNELQFESNDADNIMESSVRLNTPTDCVQLNLGAYIIFNTINPPQLPTV